MGFRPQFDAPRPAAKGTQRCAPTSGWRTTDNQFFDWMIGWKDSTTMIDGRKNDVVLQGGHVIDPANGIDGTADVLISDGKIADVGPRISAPSKADVVDVS